MLYFSKFYHYWADFKLDFKKASSRVFGPLAYKIGAAIFLLFQAFSWIMSFYIIRHLSGDLLVIHYNVDFGTDLVGSPSRVLGGPLFGLLVILLNLFLLLRLFKHKDFNLLRGLLFWGGLVINAFVAAAVLMVYINNFR